MSLENAINALVSRLETVASRLEKVENQLASGAVSAPSAGGASSSSGGGDSSASVRDYDNLINAHIRPLVAKSAQIAPEVQEQANLLLKAVEAQRDFLGVVAASKKPSDQVLQSLIGGTSEIMGQVTSLRDSKRTSKFFNNLSTISEGIGALGWVMVTPTPGPHVGDMRAGSEFYSNRILKDFKGKDQNQVDWVHDFNTFLKELQSFIKNHHTTGLTWNPQGGEAKAGAAPAAKPSAGGPPAPPAGGPPPPPSGAPPPAATKGPDMNALFGALNKGEGVTSGLKKVTNDMKAKNMKDVPALAPQAPKTTAAATKAPKDVPKKPSRLELDGNKWIVEYFVDRKDLVISETETRHAVYICGLVNSTVQIKGKVTSIAIDGCKRVGVVLENAISGVEIVNTQNAEVQITGKVPSIAIDKTSGVQLYLSKEGLDAEIVTSKSDSLNVMIPGTGDVDQIELPLPEQYKTIIKGGKTITECVQHSG